MINLKNRLRFLAGWTGFAMFLATLAFSPGCTSQGGDKAAADEQQIREIIQQYQKGWLTLDLDQLQSIWDNNYPNIIYVAVELKEPIKGWEGVKKYYEGGIQYFAQVNALDLPDISVDTFGNVAYAFSKYHFEATPQGENPQKIEGDGQITFLLRKTEGKWRLIQYHESAPHAH